MRYVRENNNAHAGGIGFAGMLQISFIVLKLCGVIGWSWWWVLAPTWIPICILMMIISISFLIVIIKR